MTTTYTATIRHHSISRAHEIAITGTLDAAKLAAIREFGDGFRDHEIAIYEDRGEYLPRLVATRRVGGGKWRMVGE
jgi:hypothetical protein